MQVHPVALSLSNNRGRVTAELAMRRSPFPKADTRKCIRQDKEKLLNGYSPLRISPNRHAPLRDHTQTTMQLFER